MSNLQKVTVLGGGVLGGQIAWHSAFKDKDVVVYDISDDALDRCRAAHEQYAAIYLADVGATDRDIADTRARLSYTTDLANAVVGRDLVIEAVPEIPDLKTKVYLEMAPLLDAHTLVATNSSTLLPRDFADATGRPDKYCAMHFANLIWAMNFVEIMAHPGTADSTLTEVTEYCIEIGMIPIPIRKEQHGYVVNTWLVQLLNAAQTLVTNGIATPEDVDRTYLLTNPGAPRGPMGIFDVVGMETAYNVLIHWGSVNGDEPMLANARYIKENFLDTGKLGMQSGEGYYSYPNPANEAPEFLAVPDISKAAEIAALTQPK
jgi:3-hydroxyacyl-CoA dehydrogenase